MLSCWMLLSSNQIVPQNCQPIWYIRNGKTTIHTNFIHKTADSVRNIEICFHFLCPTSCTHLSNWKTTDICVDCHLDVFALCLIKQLLLNKNIIMKLYNSIFIKRYTHKNRDSITTVSYFYALICFALSIPKYSCFVITWIMVSI